MKDKDVAGILKALAPTVEKAFAFTLPCERAMSAEEIVNIGTDAGIDIESVDNFQPATQWVEQGKKRLLCFTGSLFMAEELKQSGLFSV